MIIVFGTFSGLLFVTLLKRGGRAFLKSRSRDDWFLDVSGLLIQGIGVPVLQVSIFYYLFQLAFPSLHGVWKLSPFSAFLLNFVFVDYLYYWNHRLLHKKALWPFHRVHHSTKHLDFVATSRNTLWTPFLLVYLWVNAWFIFLLDDATYFLLGVSLTAALDLWRHSHLILGSHSSISMILSRWFITPAHHAWHHSAKEFNVNFGANLSFWDRIHRTYKDPSPAPTELGCSISIPMIKKLFFPY